MFLCYVCCFLYMITSAFIFIKITVDLNFFQFSLFTAQKFNFFPLNSWKFMTILISLPLCKVNEICSDFTPSFCSALLYFRLFFDILEIVANVLGSCSNKWKINASILVKIWLCCSCRGDLNRQIIRSLLRQRKTNI